MIAILDIGSNSVRLMLWADGKSLFKRISTTRLGEGLAISGALSEDAMARTIHAVQEFAKEARQMGASVHAFATAAVRSASNGKEFCDRVMASSAVPVDVVSGEEEALLALYGALSVGEDGGIIDIGGASTEICLKKGGRVAFRTSLPIGSVKLYDLCGDKKHELEEVIGRNIALLSGVSPSGKMYAVGGTASTLASIKLGLPAYDGDALQDLPLDSLWMERAVELLFRTPARERQSILGMDASRADIIAGGALLLFNIMKVLHLDEVRFSDRDNLEGYLFARNLQ